MFQSLFKLYSKYTCSATPLEDFTTESLAGILRQYPESLKAYLNVLKLPIDARYRISTQKFYLEDRQNCYIDLVLESDQVICFIENKVNSGEGWEQLDRYCQVLMREFSQKEKRLVFCTRANAFEICL